MSDPYEQLKKTSLTRISAFAASVNLGYISVIITSSITWKVK